MFEEILGVEEIEFEDDISSISTIELNSKDNTFIILEGQPEDKVINALSDINYIETKEVSNFDSIEDALGVTIN